MAPSEPNPPDLLDLKMLRLFDLLYATRSVTRAAEQLGQSQPTVSIWLGRLRRVTGDPLFVRTPDGMQPTPRADALVVTVRETLDGLRLLSAAPPKFDPASATRRFCICMTDASHINLLPDLLVRIRREAPLVQPGGGADRCTNRRPASIGRGGPCDWPGAGSRRWLYAANPVRAGLGLPRNAAHPRIGRKLTLRTYVEEGHISVKSGTGYRLLDRAIEEQRIERRIVLELPGFLGLAAIVGRTDLIATLPRQTGTRLAADFGLRLFPSPFPIEPFRVKQDPGILVIITIPGADGFAPCARSSSKRKNPRQSMTRVGTCVRWSRSTVHTASTGQGS